MVDGQSEMIRSPAAPQRQEFLPNPVVVTVSEVKLFQRLQRAMGIAQRLQLLRLIRLFLSRAGYILQPVQHACLANSRRRGIL